MCTATVTVLDTISPICDVQDITVFLDATGAAMISDADFDVASSDNCEITTTTTMPLTVDCSDIGTVMASYTIEDASGNMSTCDVSVTVLDTISPICMVQDLTIMLDGSGMASIDSASVDNGSSDNCMAFTLDLSQTDFTCANVCLLYTSPSPRDRTRSRMPSSA